MLYSVYIIIYNEKNKATFDNLLLEPYKTSLSSLLMAPDHHKGADTALRKVYRCQAPRPLAYNWYT